MKTVGLLLTILVVTVPSEAAGGGRKLLKQLQQEIKDLAKEVKALVDKKEAKDPFVKLNSDPVCFGARDRQFGSFKASKGGRLMKIKLVHLYGYISCAGTAPKFWSPWGCGYFSQDGVVDWSGVTVTTASNGVLFPPSEINRGSYHWSIIPGYSSRSPEMVMSIFDTPVAVTADQELRLWFVEDLNNVVTGDNHGRVCADVYGYFM